MYVLALGTGAVAFNAHYVRSGRSLVQVDTGWPAHASAIVAAAESVFARGTRPAVILLTDLPRDHSGCVAELARRWKVPLYVHGRTVRFPAVATPLWILAVCAYLVGRVACCLRGQIAAEDVR